MNAVTLTITLPTDPTYWLLLILVATLTVLILGAVSIALRRFPRRGRAQYLGVAIAVVASTLIAAVGALAWETQDHNDPSAAMRDSIGASLNPDKMPAPH